MYELLKNGTVLVWPHRSAQETLFDLGERKDWGEEELCEAVFSCAGWWSGFGVGVQNSSPCEEFFWADMGDVLFPLLQAFAEQKNTLPKTSAGVPKGCQIFSMLVPSSPKTLANNKKNWCDSKRPDHRWLLCLGRLLREREFPKGLLFHRRSIAALNEALSVCYGHMLVGQMDTADAMLLLSLISHWQRRRPTREVRANRQQQKPRRSTPKPVVARKDDLLHLGRFACNMEFARFVGLAPLVHLLFELALTESHLEPHSAKSKQDAPSSSNWLTAVEQQLQCLDNQELLGEEKEFYTYRIGVMDAYLKRQPSPFPPSILEKHPYIVSGQVLSQLYKERNEAEPSPKDVGALETLLKSKDWEGKAMQFSQLQSKAEKLR